MCVLLCVCTSTGVWVSECKKKEITHELVQKGTGWVIVNRFGVSYFFFVVPRHVVEVYGVTVLTLTTYLTGRNVSSTFVWGFLGSTLPVLKSLILRSCKIKAIGLPRLVILVLTCFVSVSVSFLYLFFSLFYSYLPSSTKFYLLIYTIKFNSY